jgi:hypothetical protein
VLSSQVFGDEVGALSMLGGDQLRAVTKHRQHPE